MPSEAFVVAKGAVGGAFSLAGCEAEEGEGGGSSCIIGFKSSTLSSFTAQHPEAHHISTFGPETLRLHVFFPRSPEEVGKWKGPPNPRRRGNFGTTAPPKTSSEEAGKVLPSLEEEPQFSKTPEPLLGALGRGRCIRR
mmetsp:Transcript_99343/g.206940  ORF Transcript_99343/g.206940 Transcript_99343/m.206940 type:complete len:138 (+) Transcript_99343:611-1024(+)|eukprot:CAMPEP_0206476104 /NCGR_PEP_ID=MMETSP0324_2-20121206/34510_1 /ASSEMBLY_ACC=CAM_ASM_000836 /TAXON_ID=2866 /ORGANISM="Crypthecodinium cohnii, Strain Seligo" /LENGTH=137 /DNA_ID=CAMNT_0053951657 /DNA_START=547 /DNA_END=960 /DNA_ORIENTATION=-